MKFKASDQDRFDIINWQQSTDRVTNKTLENSLYDTYLSVIK